MSVSDVSCVRYSIVVLLCFKRELTVVSSSHLKQIVVSFEAEMWQDEPEMLVVAKIHRQGHLALP